MLELMQNLWNAVLGAGSWIFALAAMTVILAIYTFPVFALVLAGLFAREARRERYGTGDVDGLRLAGAYGYTRTHAWVGGRRRGAVKVGLDDIARRVLGSVSAVELPRPGRHLQKGDPAVRFVCSGGREAIVEAPVSGVVADVNEVLVDRPEAFERAPYTRGWLFALRPDDGALGGLVRGAAAREWLKAEDARFARFVEQQFGLAAADGGHFMVPPHELLPKEKWDELVKSFLA